MPGAPAPVAYTPRISTPAHRHGRLLAAAASLVALLLLVGPWVGVAGAQSEDETTARGTVRGVVDGSPSPLEGVTVEIVQDDEVVADGQTNERGQWEITLPGGGDFVARLDPATLPEGTEAVDDPRSPFTATAGERNVVVLTPTTTAEGTEIIQFGPDTSTTSRLLNLLAQGIKLGSVIALMAVGLSLVFSVTGLVNFSHGELVTFGAVAAWYLNASWGLSLLLAGPVVLLLGAGVGWINEKGIWHPLRMRRSGRISLIVVSIGLSILFRHLFLVVFGSSSRSYDDFARQRAFDIGPFSLPPHDYVIIGLSLLLLAGVGLMLQRTRIGTAIRAVADNRELASASGIDVERVITVVWIVAGALAAFAGVLQGLTESAVWDMGFKLLLLIFSAVILGGIGTAFGAMVGGLLIGVVTQTSTYWIDNELKVAVSLAVMIIVLLVRPQGIFGQPERVG